MQTNPVPGSAAPSTFPWEEGILRRTFQLQALTYAVVGLIFLLLPNGTVRFINALGAPLHVFSPAPQSDLRFFVSLGFSYMALVTTLAVIISWDPKRYRHLMPVLAIGKFCSSFTCLLFFLFSSPTFLYLLNFLVDGSITVLVTACYAWSGLLEDSGQLAVGTEPILNAVIETLLPAGGAFEIGALETPLAKDLRKYTEDVHRRGPMGLAALLYLIELGPFLLGPRWVRFSRMSPVDRERYLGAFEHSRFGARRQLLVGLKLVTMLHFYGYDGAQRAVGYDGSYLRDKLLAGPNAAAHRARLQHP